MIQGKLVDPNGKPKAIVAVHDRIASGKEFALFQQLLAMMALGSVPAETFDASGHQMQRLLEPHELVRRAEEIVQMAMDTAACNGWVAEMDDIDKLYDDMEGSTGAGFRAAVRATPNSDIPF